MARPRIITDETVVRVNARGTKKLQKASARRAVVNFLIEQGGSASVRKINKCFGMDMIPPVQALLRGNWLENISIEKEVEE